MSVLGKLLPIAAALATTLPAFGAARLTYSINGEPVAVAWKSFPIRYAIDRRVADAMPSGAAQVERAVNEWTSAPGAQISFEDLGIVDGAKPGKDGQNSITLTDDLFAGQRFIALTTNWYDDDGHIVEADIQLDTTALKSGYNLQQLIEHETGHLLGLDHSAVLSSVMYPYVGTGAATPLDSDDRVAIATIYPRPAPSTGATLQGRVYGDDGGIFAAQVVAVNDRGEPVATGLTNRAGEFILQGVPVGTYRVYAEPLDGPFNVQNLSGAWRTANVKSFPTEFAEGGALRVESGKVYGNIVVNGSGVAHINPRWVGGCAAESTGVALAVMPVTVRAGQTVKLAVGGDGFVSGMTTFEIPSPSFRRISDFTWSSNYVCATFAVALDSVPGSAVILVRSGNDSAALTGAVRVEPKSRMRAVVAQR